MGIIHAEWFVKSAFPKAGDEFVEVTFSGLVVCFITGKIGGAHKRKCRTFPSLPEAEQAFNNYREAAQRQGFVRQADPIDWIGMESKD